MLIPRSGWGKAGLNRFPLFSHLMEFGLIQDVQTLKEINYLELDLCLICYSFASRILPSRSCKSAKICDMIKSPSNVLKRISPKETNYYIMYGQNLSNQNSSLRPIFLLSTSQYFVRNLDHVQRHTFDTFQIISG